MPEFAHVHKRECTSLTTGSAGATSYANLDQTSRLSQDRCIRRTRIHKRRKYLGIPRC